MTDIDFSALRTQPSPEFASRLRSTLAAQERASLATRRQLWHVGRIAASIAIVAAVGGALSVPSVRASAQSFLALFREVRFAALPLDRARIEAGLERLGSGGLNVERLVGDHVEVLEDGGPAAPVQSVDEAAALAGYDVHQPADVAGMLISRITVAPKRGIRVIASADRLQEVMDVMGIADLTAPRAMNGAAIGIHIAPVVSMKYEADGLEMELVQTPTPRLEVPDTVDIRALGEIGLRLVGLNPLEARRFAEAIDWTSTLVVPVPPLVEQFEQITVNGHAGLWMRTAAPGEGEKHTGIVLWSAGGRVYGLRAQGFTRTQIQEMAVSVG
jgi:hypothetical protein